MDINFIAKWGSFFFFALAALLHIGFFVMESVLFQKSGGHKVFGTRADTHEAEKIWAYNQGFYNLFLAFQMILGLYFVTQLRVQLAAVTVGVTGLFMIGAGAVLFFSSPKLRKGALIQMIPPILGFVLLSLHVTRYLG